MLINPIAVAAELSHALATPDLPDLDRLIAEIGGEPDRAQLLGFLRRHLDSGQDEIRRGFEAGDGNGARGRLCVRRRARLIDRVIGTAFDYGDRIAFPVANPTTGEELALLALGGYGRGELAPGSDIDLLFLLPWKMTPRVEQLTEFVLYLLWDLKLKVGHAVRSVEECLRAARDDVSTRTSLLEHRRLAGRADLFEEFRSRFRREIIQPTREAFVVAKLEERDQRHARQGDSRYVLEPNVKEGKGGLRDLQTLFWIARWFYDVEDIEALVARGVLLPEEAQRFAKAEDFLWTVRCALHYLTGRAEDRVTFDLQPALGRQLGYTDHAGTSGVERFMKHYFLVAKDVGDLTRLFCAAILTETRRPTRLRFASLWRLFGRREIEGFRFDGQFLDASPPELFESRPVEIIRLFHVAHRHGLDIHPNALRAITRVLRRLDQDWRNDPEANRLFLDILVGADSPETTLRRMNEAGVLGRFVPDWGRVVAQMQYDMYHCFTVDEHTLRALGFLHRAMAGALAEALPLATRVAPKVKSRRALFVALLLHDVAKGRGGDHAVLGARIVRQLGPRFGLTAEETDTASWLIRHHIAMSDAAFKRDLEDPRTLADFVELVQSVERLRLLTLLTVADINAVGPGRWSSWRGALLGALHDRAEAELTGGMADRPGLRAAGEQAAVRALLPDWSDAAFAGFVAITPPGYWHAFEPETQARQARLVDRARTPDRRLTVATDVDPVRQVTTVTVLAADHPGLFSRLAGALALAGCSIVDARIFTLADGTALDVFQVQDPAGGAVATEERRARLAQTIEQVLQGDIRLIDALAQRMRSQTTTRTRAFRVTPRVIIDNNASQTHTVIEVTARDRLGLLWEITRCLTQLSLSIASAKVTTYGLRAVDTFYVKNVFGLKIDHEQKLERIRAELMAVLELPGSGGD